MERGGSTALSDEDLAPQEKPERSRYMRCDFCGGILGRDQVRWIKVHDHEYDQALLALERARVGRRDEDGRGKAPN